MADKIGSSDFIVSNDIWSNTKFKNKGRVRVGGTVVCHSNKFKAILTSNVDNICNGVAKKCVKTHEQVHIDQLTTHAPNLCKGKKNNSIITVNQKDQGRYEAPAYAAELACLKKEKDKKNTTPGQKHCLSQVIKATNAGRDIALKASK